jgi:hypothetical protein
MAGNHQSPRPAPDKQHGVIARWVCGSRRAWDARVRSLTVRLLENRNDAVCRFGCLPQDGRAVRVDRDGALLAEGGVASEPEALADWLGAHAPEAGRIGLETGPLSVWLWNELKERGLPVHV